MLPIGVCIRAIRAEPGWWLESAQRLDAAGFAGLWCWDHFVGRGDQDVPVVGVVDDAGDGGGADDRRRPWGRSCST